MSKLIECSMCEKMISPNATSCPNCGEPMIEDNNSISNPTGSDSKEFHSENKKYDVLMVGYSGEKRDAQSILFDLMGLSYISSEELLNCVPQIIRENIDKESATSLVLDLNKGSILTKIVDAGREKIQNQCFNELVEAQNKRLQENKQNELEKEREREKIKCSKCGSENLSANKSGFGFGKAVVGGLIAGPVGLAAGAIGSNKTVITCLKCGHKFKPGK